MIHMADLKNWRTSDDRDAIVLLAVVVTVFMVAGVI